MDMLVGPDCRKRAEKLHPRAKDEATALTARTGPDGRRLHPRAERRSEGIMLDAQMDMLVGQSASGSEQDTSSESAADGSRAVGARHYDAVIEDPLRGIHFAALKAPGPS